MKWPLKIVASHQTAWSMIHQWPRRNLYASMAPAWFGEVVQTEQLKTHSKDVARFETATRCATSLFQLSYLARKQSIFPLFVLTVEALPGGCPQEGMYSIVERIYGRIVMIRHARTLKKILVAVLNGQCEQDVIMAYRCFSILVFFLDVSLSEANLCLRTESYHRDGTLG